MDECKICTNNKRCSTLDKARMTACRDFRRKEQKIPTLKNMEGINEGVQKFLQRSDRK